MNATTEAASDEAFRSASVGFRSSSHPHHSDWRRRRQGSTSGAWVKSNQGPVRSGVPSLLAIGYFHYLAVRFAQQPLSHPRAIGPMV